jgi:hypothetical protein
MQCVAAVLEQPPAPPAEQLPSHQLEWQQDWGFDSNNYKETLVVPVEQSSKSTLCSDSSSISRASSSSGDVRQGGAATEAGWPAVQFSAAAAAAAADAATASAAEAELLAVQIDRVRLGVCTGLPVTATDAPEGDSSSNSVSCTDSGSRDAWVFNESSALPAAAEVHPAGVHQPVLEGWPGHKSTVGVLTSEGNSGSSSSRSCGDRKASDIGAECSAAVAAMVPLTYEGPADLAGLQLGLANSQQAVIVSAMQRETSSSNDSSSNDACTNIGGCIGAAAIAGTQLSTGARQPKLDEQQLWLKDMPLASFLSLHTAAAAADSSTAIGSSSPGRSPCAKDNIADTAAEAAHAANREALGFGEQQHGSGQQQQLAAVAWPATLTASGRRLLHRPSSSSIAAEWDVVAAAGTGGVHSPGATPASAADASSASSGGSSNCVAGELMVQAACGYA